MNVQKLVGNFMHPVSSVVTFPCRYLVVVLRMFQRIDLEAFERAYLLSVVLFQHYAKVAITVSSIGVTNEHKYEMMIKYESSCQFP